MKITSLAVCALLVSCALPTISSCGGKKTDRSSQTAVNQSDTQIKEVLAIGKVTPENGVSLLASPADGIVEQILVHTGDSVRKGAAVIRLNSVDASLSLKEAQARSKTGEGEVKTAQILVSQGQTALAEARRKFEDAKELLEGGAVSAEEVKRLKNAFEDAQLQQSKLESELLSKKAKLAETEASQDQKEEDLNKKVLSMPFDGLVLEIMPKVGEALNRYQTYARVAPSGELVVKAEVDEMFAGSLSQGQSCKISLSGLPEKSVEGKISGVSPDLRSKSLFSDSGEDLQDRRVREVTIRFSNDWHWLIDTKVECLIFL